MCTLCEPVSVAKYAAMEAGLLASAPLTYRHSPRSLERDNIPAHATREVVFKPCMSFRFRV